MLELGIELGIELGDEDSSQGMTTPKRQRAEQKQRGRASLAKPLAKWGLPALISTAAVVYLTRTILRNSDFESVSDHLTPRAAGILICALIVYGAWSLLIEAITLRRLVHTSPRDFTLFTAARVKAASYLLAIVHYALGAATLGFLLHRRAGVSPAKSAGIVMLIMMFDLGMVLSLVAVGATLISETEVKLQFGLIAILIAFMVGGLSLLRAPFSLGPLDRLRKLALFDTARTIATRDLLELAGLRLLFVMGFEFMGWAALYAFEIEIPFGTLLVKFSGVAMVGMLPAVAGIGPSQIAMVEFFKAYGSAESLLACSVAMAAGLVIMRALTGIVFAREFSRLAYAATRTPGNRKPENLTRDALVKKTTMSQIAFTGERLHAGSSLFGVDLARHRAPYVYALDFAGSGIETSTPGADTGTGRVLDLGCGSGYGTAELADALPRVVGLDRISHDDANSRGNIDWIRADLRGNPLAPGSFDLIVSFQVIEHLDDPHVYLDSIAGLLAPGGTAILTTPNILTSDKINPFHVHEYESEELRDCLAPYFDQVVMQGVGLTEKVKPYFDARLARIEKIMRFDPLGIRNLLPQALVVWLFAKGALLVRRSIQKSGNGMPKAYVQDFPIAPPQPADIDLLALCRRNPRPLSAKLSGD